jgi:hypothetical protein
VEFRLTGKWGTVCAKGVKPSAGRRICRDLKYKDGITKNPSYEGGDASGYCNGYDGEDHCGPAPSDIHYMGLNCNGNEANIMDCFRDMATDCTH